MKQTFYISVEKLDAFKADMRAKSKTFRFLNNPITVGTRCEISIEHDVDESAIINEICEKYMIENKKQETPEKPSDEYVMDFLKKTFKF